MTYEQALAHIHALEAFGSRPGLTRITELLRLLGNPQRALSCIHVAGTNGKGSACKMLEGIFRCAGLKTGLTISPYVTEFRERIQINGAMIPPQKLAEYTAAVADAAAKMADGPTEFEFITALAFLYFADERCEAVVLETGLGGRFDATNVIEHPVVSVLMSISRDHMAVLGDTVEQIAFEKCGILKPGAPAAAYPVQPGRVMEVIRREAAGRSCTLRIPALDKLQILEESWSGSRFLYEGEEYGVRMPGRHQIYNALTVIEAARLAVERGFALSEEDIRRGLLGAQMPARLEVLSDAPLVLLDGAHNEDGARALAESLHALVEEGSLTVIMGMLADKDYQSAISRLSPLTKALIAVTPDNPRALPAERLADIARDRIPDSVAAADYDRALKLARTKSAGGPVLICGSLYLASSIRQKALEFARSLQKPS